MPRPPLPQSAVEFLARPNHATMATLGARGQPISVATWYLLVEEGTLLVNIGAGRARIEHLRRDPRFALTAMDPENWYTHVSLQATAVEISDDPDLSVIDRIARHYTGQEYRDRDGARVSVRGRIDAWYGWGAQRSRSS